MPGVTVSAEQLTNDWGFYDFENEYEILTVQIPLA